MVSLSKRLPREVSTQLLCKRLRGLGIRSTKYNRRRVFFVLRREIQEIKVKLGLVPGVASDSVISRLTEGRLPPLLTWPDWPDLDTSDSKDSNR